MAIDPAAVIAHTRAAWDDAVQPALTEYIRVPALSSAFDPDWAANGHLDAVVGRPAGRRLHLVAAYLERQRLRGLVERQGLHDHDARGGDPGESVGDGVRHQATGLHLDGG